jgi:metal-responsive CopG/Arc/MetJ family transcriptional regulator
MTDIQVHTNRIGISLPESLIEKIDIQRGDINRSRFILRLLELALQNKEINNK